MKIVFSCKDDLLAKYYEEAFGEVFTEQAQAWPRLTEMEREGFKSAWKLEMFREARIQEHYDYDKDEEGRRHLKYEMYHFRKDRASRESGLQGSKVTTTIPVLLIPDVEVVE